MGAAVGKQGPCCHVERAPRAKPTVAAAAVAGVWPGLKPEEEYAGRYEELEASSGSTCSNLFVLVRSASNGLQYSCRRVPKPELPRGSQHEAVERHLKVLCGLSHPHLCKVVECFESAEEYIMVCEHAQPPHMLQHITDRGFTTQEREASELLRQLLSALAYGHRRGVAHGLLRPDVMTFTRGGSSGSSSSSFRRSGGNTPQLKLVDMGLGFVLRPPLSTSTSSSELQERSGDGKPWYPGLYAAPEALPDAVATSDMLPQHDGAVTEDSSSEQSQEEAAQVARRPSVMGASPPKAMCADIWAAGTFAYHLLVGSAPFVDVSSNELLERKADSPVPFPRSVWETVSKDALEVVQSMLLLEPHLRPTASRLLRRPWLNLRREAVPGNLVLGLLKNAVANLKEAQFKKLVMRVLVRQLPDDHQHLIDALRVFRALDRDRDGLLGLEELARGIRKFPKLQAQLEDVATLFGAADRDGSGSLDAADFVAATLPPEVACNEKLLWNTFRAFDRNDDGMVTVDEVITVARRLEGCLLATEQLDELIAALHLELDCLRMPPNGDVLVEGDHLWVEQYGRCGHIMKAIVENQEQRFIDFGEFVYLNDTRRQGRGRRALGICKKELFRVVEQVVDMDFYRRDFKAVPRWPDAKDTSAHTFPSVHSFDGGLAKVRRHKEGRHRRRRHDERKTSKRPARKGGGGRLS